MMARSAPSISTTMMQVRSGVTHRTHRESQSKVDDRDDLTPKVDDPFDVFRGPGDGG